MLLDRLSSANCLQAFLWASYRRGFLLGRRPCKPTCCSVWRTVWALTSWPSTSATSKAMLAALMRLFFEASFCTWCTAQGLNFFDRPLRGLFQVKPVLENICMTLATVLYCRGLHGSTWIRKPEVRPETRAGSGPKLLRVSRTQVGFGISSLGSRVIKINVLFPKGPD